MSDMRGWNDEERRARALAASLVNTEAIIVIQSTTESDSGAESPGIPGAAG